MMGAASLTLGIISIILALISAGAFGWVSIILGIIGMVLGGAGRQEPDSEGIATAGLVCSLIGLILGLILFVACVSFIGSIPDL